MSLTTCPFQKDRKYRVKRDYSFLNHHFKVGELVLFSTHAYSAKEGVTRYWFNNVKTGGVNVWHVFDNADEMQWSDFFEECAA